MSSKKERIVLTVSFVLFLLINGILVVIHEPWRDEIHAWLMAKYMSVPEMIAFSRYEGHPLLWHLILYPFAHLGAPVWTMHVISYVCVAAAAFLFIFKTKLNAFVKIVILFTVPFIYTFSSISRNYCLILLLGMAIAVMYGKRYEYPLIYSILIALMVFTHAMAWGFVAGATIAFHIYEIFVWIIRKSDLNRKILLKITAGLIIIALSTVVAILTLYGQRNSGFSVYHDDYTDRLIRSIIIIIALSLISLILCKGKLWKEVVILTCSLAFMILIYKAVYSNVIFQRVVLVQVFLIVLLVIGQTEDKRVNVYLAAVYLCSLIINGAIMDTYFSISSDIMMNYSSAQEMAEYINTNLPDEEMILVDAGVFAQSIEPYTDKELYDIRYNAPVKESLYSVNEEEIIIQSIREIPEHEEYKGHYIILYYNFDQLPFEEVYRTSTSYIGEDFTLYYIPE